MSRVDFKIVLLGASGAGKTSLMRRFVHDSFKVNSNNTYGLSFVQKAVQIQNEKYILGIWDTAGSERYESITKNYYRGAAAAIICFDVTDPVSLARAKFWMREMKNVDEQTKIFLCGTKKDLVDDDSNKANPRLDLVQTYADGVLCKLFLTSSKTGENVGELFLAIVEDLKADDCRSLEESFVIVEKPEKSKSKCCFSFR